MIELDTIMQIILVILGFVIPAMGVYLRKYKKIILFADEITDKLAASLDDESLTRTMNTFDMKNIADVLSKVGKTAKHKPSLSVAAELLIRRLEINKEPELERVHQTWYQTNFEETPKGNAIVLSHTDTIRVSSTQVRSFITAKLYKLGAKHGNLELMQIAQGNSLIPIEMKLLSKDTDGAYKQYEPGTYELHVTGDYGTSDAVGSKDRFIILP